MEKIIKDNSFNDYKDILTNYDNFKKTQQSSRKLSKYEKTYIIGVRAQQLSMDVHHLLMFKNILQVL